MRNDCINVLKLIDIFNKIIHSCEMKFYQTFTSNDQVPGTMLGLEETKMRKKQFLSSRSLMSSGGRRKVKQQP